MQAPQQKRKAHNSSPDFVKAVYTSTLAEMEALKTHGKLTADVVRNIVRRFAISEPGMSPRPMVSKTSVYEYYKNRGEIKKAGRKAILNVEDEKVLD
jgi:hypothetical protein